MHLTAFNLPALTLVEMVDDKKIELNPPFQRKDVWNDTARSRLIETILLGLPIPALFFTQENGRTPTDGSRFVVVDGKQRLTALHRFIKGDFALKMDRNSCLSADEYHSRKFSDLTDEDQRLICEAPISYFKIGKKHGRIEKDADRVLFRRLNLGMPLDPAEWVKARAGVRTEALVKFIANVGLGTSPSNVPFDERGPRSRPYQAAAILLAALLAESTRRLKGRTMQDDILINDKAKDGGWYYNQGSNDLGSDSQVTKFLCIVVDHVEENLSEDEWTVLQQRCQTAVLRLHRVFGNSYGTYGKRAVKVCEVGMLLQSWIIAKYGEKESNDAVLRRTVVKLTDLAQERKKKVTVNTFPICAALLPSALEAAR